MKCIYCREMASGQYAVTLWQAERRSVPLCARCFHTTPYLKLTRYLQGIDPMVLEIYLATLPKDWTPRCRTRLPITM